MTDKEKLAFEMIKTAKELLINEKKAGFIWPKSELPDVFMSSLAKELKKQGFGGLHGETKGGKDFLYFGDMKIIEITDNTIAQIIKKLKAKAKK